MSPLPQVPCSSMEQHILNRVRGARVQVCEDRGGRLFQQSNFEPGRPLDILPAAFSLPSRYRTTSVVGAGRSASLAQCLSDVHRRKLHEAGYRTSWIFSHRHLGSQDAAAVCAVKPLSTFGEMYSPEFATSSSVARVITAAVPAQRRGPLVSGSPIPSLASCVRKPFGKAARAGRFVSS